MKLPPRLQALLAALRGPRRRSFAAGQLSRLTNSWTTDPGSINRTLRYELRTLRARSRQLCGADGYAAKFLHAVEANVAGPRPFHLQAKIRRPRGALDTRVNQAIEQAWRDWSRPENCDITGRHSLDAMHRLILRTIARDGEVLVLLYDQGGKYGFQLQVLDIDRLDEERNETLRNGGAIKMGVEVDRAGRPVAYHILTTHPGEFGQWGAAQRESIRYPAEAVLHLFVPGFPEQVRGVPWLTPVMSRLWNLSGFEEAAVINARTAAAKMGFYTSPDGSIPAVTDGTDSAGRFVQDASPGAFEVLPVGYSFQSFDPKFPDEAIEPFIRTSLRGIASGLGVAYHSLANDPSNVNFSTARVALLEERDLWQGLQSWYVDHVCSVLYDRWRASLGNRGIISNELFTARYESVQWQCQTWDWVDPRNEAQAKLLELEAGLTSRTRIAAEKGADIEDIFDEIATEQALAAEKGISLAAAQPADQQDSPAEDTDEAAKETERRLRVVG